MGLYKLYLKRNIGKILTNEMEINEKLILKNIKLTNKYHEINQELAIIKDSKLFKLWPLYTKIKNIFTK